MADRGGPIPITGFGLLAGPANVILQLSHPPVGYGVKDSRVESGQLFRHPLGRSRTTFTYLAVALLGNEADRARYRKAVNGSHTQVHSLPGDPVPYNAFDRDLQLWVAACLYFGLEDMTRRLGIPVAPEDAEAVYQASAVLGTTLQVRPEQWPVDREAFWTYWRKGLEEVEIDGDVRAYLDAMTRAAFLPGPLPALLGPFQTWVTSGLLPAEVRSAMGYDWTDADERRLDRLLGVLGAVHRRLPGPAQRFPFNLMLLDLRLRHRLGRPLV